MSTTDDARFGSARSREVDDVRVFVPLAVLLSAVLRAVCVAV